ncbi:MAG: lytic transglycosylase, partial [Prevotellaceae bacterium]|nr:lytic transglycosylase [Prevotellaceae bacterium]
MMKKLINILTLTMLTTIAWAQETVVADSVAATDSTVQAEVKPAEPEIILPEALLYDVDSMLNDYNAKQYLKAFDCDTSDISAEISDSIYVERLSRLPRLMEMVYNDVVRKVIDKYTGRLRPTVSFLLGSANFYFPIFEEIL